MIRPNNATYIVNKNKRTVVCISTGHTADVEKYIDKDLIDKHILIGGTDMFIADKFIGIAKCHPEDTWDELIGKKVAYEKMCSNYNGAVNNAIATIESKLRAAANLINSRKTNIWGK